MDAITQRQTGGYSIVFAIILSLLILGCGSDGSDGVDGAIGPQGPAGPPGAPADPPTSENPVELTVTINSITINSAPIVNFSVVDQDGLIFTNLSDPRFMLAKLVPGTNGDSSYWQSYINRVETADGNGPGTQDTIQATQDRGGNLINNGDGTYSYTFVNDIANITQPIVVSYEPNLTHRLAIQISGNELPVTNVIYDWLPIDGSTSQLITRDIVKTESCNGCHDKLAIHGGGRTETQLCVTCHNPGSIDANSGNTVDFKVMVHKIHRGAQLPSVIDGGEYAIWGFRDTKHDYSDVHLPMDIRNCSQCHDDANSDTPDAANWHLVPTIEACGSCHDDVDFSLGEAGGHAGGVMDDNSGCTICHREGGFADSVVESHIIDSQVAAQLFQFNILSIDSTAPGEFPEVTFSVTNPQADNAAYDILSDPEFTAAGGASRLAIDIAWNTGDYTNEGSGSGIARSVSLNPLTSAIDNNDGTFSVTSSIAIPTVQTGSGAIGIEGHPAGDFDGDMTYTDRVPVVSVVDYFAITDTQPNARREIVSNEKCLACHVNLSLHGNNRNDNTEICVLCHNPSNTDLERRPASPSDNLLEQTIDMKYMIHAIHASSMRETPYILYGFGNSEHDYSDVHYPGILNNCESCHLNGTYELPLADSVQGTTIDTGADPDDRSDDIKITATAAACSSCHDDPLSKAHMIQNGGASFSTSQAAIDNFEVVETCVFCHGQGNSDDVSQVHGID